MAAMKKQDMAQAAEQLLIATGWLPALMRTPRGGQEPAEQLRADEGKNLVAYSAAAE